MYIPPEKKTEYWDYFTSPSFKNYRHHGMTDRRLVKVKQMAMEYDYLWDDVILRHGGLERTPAQMAQEDQFVFSHCVGNFFGILGQLMYLKGIIK